MAETISFELVSPERLLMEADVWGVMVPGREGDFTVLPGHAPVISTLRPAVVDVFETEGADPVRIFVRGGFAEVGPDGLTLLAQQAVDLAELDAEQLAQQIRNAEEDVADAKDDAARDAAQSALDGLRLIEETLKLA